MILDSDVLTAILPIRIDQNPFWTSSRGIECVENFLETCKRISDIDRFIVITRDDPIRLSAKHHSMEISTIDIPGSVDRPYTFKQTRSLARNFKNFCKNQTDTLIIADHRNLFLSVDDITEALVAHQQNPETGVISLAFCRDYPCQWKSYFKFLGCVVINFEELGIMDEVSNIHRAGSNRGVTCHTKDDEDIAISVFIDGPRYGISFRTQRQIQESFVSQIIPFDANGPQYSQSHVLHISTPEYETQIDIDSVKLTGMIFILTRPSQSSEYDSVELFTPPNAPWELGKTGNVVFNTETNEPMIGRQQFPPTYTYDGSLCILVGSKQLEEESFPDLTPFTLKESCIVTDWVDYCHCQ